MTDRLAWQLWVRGSVLVGLVAAVLLSARETPSTLMPVIAVVLTIDGIVLLYATVRERSTVRWLLLVQGLIGVTLGVVALVADDDLSTALTGIFAAWALITGGADIILAFLLRGFDDLSALIAIGGILSGFIGAVLLTTDDDPTLLVILFGAYQLGRGVLYISAARLRLARLAG